MDGQTDGAEADRQGAGSGGARFRPDDVLKLECPFTETTVTEVSRFHVAVRWPWLEVDSEAKNIRWNGQRALPTPEAHDWEIFRTEPVEAALKAGDTCRVGIPPATVVHVLAVHHFDPPLVTGMLPRPASYLEVLRQGETYDPEFEDQATRSTRRVVNQSASNCFSGPMPSSNQAMRSPTRTGVSGGSTRPGDWHPLR